MWICTVSHTYCFNGPSALVLSAVVIRRIMVKLCVCFSFKSNIQQVNCEITKAANEYFRGPRAFYVFEHFPCGM